MRGQSSPNKVERTRSCTKVALLVACSRFCSLSSLVRDESILPWKKYNLSLQIDLRDAHLQALLGGGHSHRSRNTTTTTTNIYADPLLSSFGLGFATSDAEEPSKSSVPVLDDTSILNEAPPQPWESRYI